MLRIVSVVGALDGVVVGEFGFQLVDARQAGLGRVLDRALEAVQRSGAARSGAFEVFGGLCGAPSAGRVSQLSRVGNSVDVDEDLDSMSHEYLVAEVRRLRAGIREHRDSSGHALCWHHPKLWGLLPEPVDSDIAVPPWPRFLRGCVAYRESLDAQRPDAPAWDREWDETAADPT